MLKHNEGIIIFSKKIKDNDLFIKVLNNDDQIIAGMVYGGTSSKKKSIYQLGYFIDYTLNQKNNMPPLFKAEIIKPYINNIIHDKYKSFCLLTVISLINLSIIEGQKINGIFKSVKNFLLILSNHNHWLSYFCQWLFILLEKIGYQIEYTNKSDYQYFNLITHKFEKNRNNNTVIFPHSVFHNSKVIIYEDIYSFFEIFESILIKNHLDNINYKMPINYFNFKNAILKELSK